MAKQEELKKKILKILLPKAVTGVVLTFQNPVFSPRRNHQVVHKYYKHHGPMIPDEARRRRSKNGRSGNRSTKSLELTSPKVSCMGQIKNKKHQHQQQRIKKVKSKRIALPNNVHQARPLLKSVSEVKNNKQTSTFRRIFWRGERKSSRAVEAHGESAAAAPALSQMKRFESRRGALANFDWKAHVVTLDDDDDDEDDETIISFSEPIAALHPKTEINLWKRRNMAPPPPLRSIPQPAPI